MKSWMGSQGHRDNILRPNHRRVSIGLAWDDYNVRFYQHFEGDYVWYKRLPLIKDGALSIEGTTRNEAKVPRTKALGVQIYYDPPPGPLTRGQLSQTRCCDNGLRVASLRWPLSDGWTWPTDTYTAPHKGPCIDPYLVPEDVSPPVPRAFRVPPPQAPPPPPRQVEVPWITALEWWVTGDEFHVAADITPVLEEHGPGVYSVMVWAPIDGVSAPISHYSIFHGIDRPAGYGR